MLMRTGHKIVMKTGDDSKDVKEEVSDLLYDAFGGIVRSGPFENMKVLKETSEKGASLAPRLIGCYEEELHGVFETQIARLSRIEKPTISVFGCAEGYYAVGLKRRLPNATVFPIDEDKSALAICERAAAANGVELVFGAPLLFSLSADLIVMDVEGAETEYLNPVEFPMVLDRHMIVEIHNWDMHDGVKVGQLILDRFRASHRVVMITEGSRNPNRYDFLSSLTSDQRWATVNEGRPHLMFWYVMEPKGQVLS